MKEKFVIVTGQSGGDSLKGRGPWQQPTLVVNGGSSVREVESLLKRAGRWPIEPVCWVKLVAENALDGDIRRALNGGSVSCPEIDIEVIRTIVEEKKMDAFIIVKGQSGGDPMMGRGPWQLPCAIVLGGTSPGQVKTALEKAGRLPADPVCWTKVVHYEKLSDDLKNQLLQGEHGGNKYPTIDLAVIAAAAT